MMKRILFYGSISEENKDQVNKFLEEFVGQLLSDDYIVLTREGTAKPENYKKIWLDNMVLDIACAYRDNNKLGHDRVASFVMNDDENVSKHNRQRILISSTNRFEGYQEMMNQCDVIISIGGTEGVYRLGLFAAAMHKLFIPIAIDTGSSRKLVKELKDYLTNEFSPKIYEYISHTELENTTIRKLTKEIDECISKVKKRKKEKPIITRQDFLGFIQNNPEEMFQIPFASFIKLLSVKTYWTIAGAIIAFGTLVGGIVWAIASN